MTLELVVVFPVVLLLMFGIVQAGLHYHARNVAQAAAHEGVTAATLFGGTSSGARSAAQHIIDTAGDGMFVDAGVQVSRTATTFTVTVTGRSLNLVPGLPTPVIRQTVAGTVERPS